MREALNVLFYSLITLSINYNVNVALLSQLQKNKGCIPDLVGSMVNISLFSLPAVRNTNKNRYFGVR